MKVLNYKYILPDTNGLVADLNRSGYMTAQYIEKLGEFMSSLQLSGVVAVLYAAGVVVSSSEARNVGTVKHELQPVNTSGLCIKELSAYSMHKWIGLLNEPHKVQYASINGNTCASSMFSLYEAEHLLSNGFDQVIIVTEEMTSYNTVRIFQEHNIDLKIGEGCAIIHLGKAESPADEDITNCKWSYEYNRNPFGVTSSGYEKVLSECDIINPHGTGTDNNEQAESIYDKPQLRYKEKYGHTQGVSGLLEVCLTLDDPLRGIDVLCISSGLGGFYGSCIVHK